MTTAADCSKHPEKSSLSVVWCSGVDGFCDLAGGLLRISTQNEPFTRSEFTAALNVDMLDAGRSPNADSPPTDDLIAMVRLKKKT